MKGFGVFSEEHPTVSSAEISSRGVWSTIHVEHGADYEEALFFLCRHVRQHYPWIWDLLPQRAKSSLTTAKRGGQITR